MDEEAYCVKWKTITLNSLNFGEITPIQASIITTGTSVIFSEIYNNAVEATEKRLYNVGYWIKKCILD